MSSLILLATLGVESLELVSGPLSSTTSKGRPPSPASRGGILIADRLTGSIDPIGCFW